MMFLPNSYPLTSQTKTSFSWWHHDYASNSSQPTGVQWVYNSWQFQLKSACHYELWVGVRQSHATEIIDLPKNPLSIRAGLNIDSWEMFHGKVR